MVDSFIVAGFSITHQFLSLNQKLTKKKIFDLLLTGALLGFCIDRFQHLLETSNVQKYLIYITYTQKLKGSRYLL